MAFPNDPLFQHQWHLLNTGQSGGTPGVDLNVVDAWDDYDGRGVKIAVYDSGVEYTHPDLLATYDARLHLVLPDGSVDDGVPRDLTIVDDNHGTAVAGIIGAATNNGEGVAGIAHGARLTSIKIFDYFEIDAVKFAAAMAHQSAFDVVNHSWGPAPFFDVGTDDIAPFALEASATLGRAGLGTIMVIAVGNDRLTGIDGNNGAFENDRHVFATAAASDEGEVMWYSTPGANVLLAAPVDRNLFDSDRTDRTTTTDFTGADGYSPDKTAGFDEGDYTDAMNGTSSAAPMVSGVAALMLQANQDLGYRDVQAILAATARQTGGDGVYELYEWQTNGAGHWNGGGMHHSNDYGFGLVDARSAVRLAESWSLQSTTVNEVSTTTLAFDIGFVLPDQDAGGLSYSFAVTEDISVESLQLDVDITHSWLGDLRIVVVSPEGTESVVLNRLGVTPDFSDETDASGVQGEGQLDFRFTSWASWGESSGGTWTVTVSDLGTGGTGSVDALALTLFGSPQSADDQFVFNDEYATLVAADASRTTLIDADGGIDTLNASAVSSASAIDLGAGTATIDGVALTFTAGSLENAHGGDGADSLAGSDLGNSLHGWRGDDTLDGGAGSDTLDGGAGTDTALFATSRDNVAIALSGGDLLVSDATGTDRLVDVERLDLTDADYRIVHRLYDEERGVHFLTADGSERETLVASGAFRDEGVFFAGVESGSTQSVWRFYDSATHTHYFTIDDAERATLQATRSELRFEGEAFQAYVTETAGATAIHRFHSVDSNEYVFTASEEERAAILASLPQLSYQGVAFYAEYWI